MCHVHPLITRSLMVHGTCLIKTISSKHAMALGSRGKSLNKCFTLTVCAIDLHTKHWVCVGLGVCTGSAGGSSSETSGSAVLGVVGVGWVWTGWVGLGWVGLDCVGFGFG